MEDKVRKDDLAINRESGITREERGGGDWEKPGKSRGRAETKDRKRGQDDLSSIGQRNI